MTVIYVTHDQHEAMTLAGRIAVMDRGRIEQCGPAGTLLAQPRTEFVASFFGHAQIVTVEAVGVDAQGLAVEWAGGQFHLPAGPTSKSFGSLKVALRPGAIQVVGPQTPDAGAAVITDVIARGDVLRLECTLPDFGSLWAEVDVRHTHYLVGDHVSLTVDPHNVIVLP